MKIGVFIYIVLSLLREEQALSSTTLVEPETAMARLTRLLMPLLT